MIVIDTVSVTFVRTETVSISKALLVPAGVRIVVS